MAETPKSSPSMIPRFRHSAFPRLVVFAFAAASGGCVLLPTVSGPPPALEAAPGRMPVRRADLEDVRGVIHVHSFLSHDARGTVAEIAEAARAAGVRFVAMTDHFREPGPQVSEGARGERDGVLFLVGVELKRASGSFLALGLGDATPTPTARLEVRAFPRDPAETLVAIRHAGGLSFVGHAETFAGWEEAPAFDGLEVANLHADAKDDPWWSLLLSALFEPPGCFFTRLIDHPEANLARWDALGTHRRVPGVGGCDAHANVRIFGPLGGTVGTYEEAFRALTTHALVARRPGRSPDARAVLEALRQGRCYIAFEMRGDATGFWFDLADGAGVAEAIQGEEVRFRPGQWLRAHAPGGARAQVALLRDGAPLAESPAGAGLEIAVPGPGVYRVEVTLDGKPFILSNPIYVRP